MRPIRECTQTTIAPTERCRTFYERRSQTGLGEVMFLLLVFWMVSQRAEKPRISPHPMDAAGLLGLNLVFTFAAKSADADGSPSPQFYKKLKYGPAGAVVQWQDRQNVGNLWGQNQHIPHILSTINP